MTTALKITPMLQQYLEIKEEHRDTILFYRMGDFYEMFFEDAEIASKILGITLTSRNNKSDAAKVPMCGIPYHAVNGYLAKLIRAGKRVAICEQVENPAEAKGIVRREVIRVVSPGVITENHLLEENSNNYIAALSLLSSAKSTIYGISFLDLSTGEFLLDEYLEENTSPERLFDQLSRLAPAELLINSEIKPDSSLLTSIRTLLPDLCVTARMPTLFHYPSMLELLKEHFGVLSLDGFGCGPMSAGVIAAGVLLDYVKETQKADLDHIEKLIPIDLDTILQIDDASRRNLELTQTLVGSKREGSLLAVLDQTCTPMGARLLKHNLLFPLQDVATITDKLDALTYFVDNTSLRQNLRGLLDTVYDLERLNSRMTLGTGNGRDMLAMKQSLGQLPAIAAMLSDCRTKALAAIAASFDPLTDLYDLLEQAIHLEAPHTLHDGNLIKEGFNAELDELIAILRDGKQTILNLESAERAATGIAKLKVGYNKVFGYYLEISNAQAGSVPDHYIRKQTLVNAERFITPELKQFEEKVLGAEERRTELEFKLFCDIRSKLVRQSSRILTTAHFLAQLDVFSALAEIAKRYNYHRPEVTDGEEIIITEGRHPVIERALAAGKFVPNDVHLDQTSQEVLIITGPNMAGKSTVLRQTALIVLMAQMGSYVPAETARIGVVDRIFTRVGAMDDLRRGQSTFMVEMNETANILNNATERSLVILDEIGRGTSTYDGLAIAWAVAEELVQKNDRGVKTLFATHYHELTDMATTQERVKNFSIAVREWNESIIFLHKLVQGGTNRSYGIQVAALAGVPEHVVARAEEILRNIQHSEFDQTGQPTIAKSQFPRKSKRRSHPNQLSLFQPPADPLRDYLQLLDVNELSPRQALDVLYKLKKYLD